MTSTVASDDAPVTFAPPAGTVGRPTIRAVTILFVLFFLTVPFINPWVRGDGVGYYAYVRSILVEHRLDFSNDWRSANESFAQGRVLPDGTISLREFTSTGHLNNHFTVGPAILWAPFLVPVHYGLLTLQRFGVKAQANGYSRPYLVTMAFATAAYGFLGLLISFRIACHYAGQLWAFVATVGIWFASSLPVYMYFNPSWSHAHSVFAVAIFLWYWNRTRLGRTLGQWLLLGLLSGLMLDIYYPNVAVLLIPLLESARQYAKSWRGSKSDWRSIRRVFSSNIVYSIALLLAFTPTLVTRKIIYGSPFTMGYANEWKATPSLFPVLFSSDHGLLTWTPILVIAIGGLFLLRKYDSDLAGYLIVSFLAFFVLISLHSNWDGLSSFGNRFFISLTPCYVLGLAVALREFATRLASPSRALAFAGVTVGTLIVWNLAFIFQWGTHMIPARGPISWKQMVHNQFVAVPHQATRQITAYFANRRGLMHNIEEQDVRQLKHPQSNGISQ